MKTIDLAMLHEVASSRRPGYLDAVQAKGRTLTISGRLKIQLDDADYAAIAAAFATPMSVIVQGASAKKPLGLGDMVGAVATPIASALGLPCVDPATKQLKPESKCQKRKDLLNKIHLP